MTRIAVDTGGTFTDCVHVRDGQIAVLKVPSTPLDPAQAVLTSIAQVASEGRVDVRLGTTVATNALLERKGARVAFVATSGFEDMVEIGRQARPVLYDLLFEKPAPLVAETLRFGIRERTDCTGTVVEAPAESDLRYLVHAVREAGAESIALCLLFSFANPQNERRVAEALRNLGVPVSVSHEILPEFREYERASTVTINAYVAPKVGAYVGSIQQELHRRGSRLSVMQSSGGIIDAATASKEPVRTVLSGPAGGVIGAAQVARQAGFTKILSFDMGGTSTDVALIDAEAPLRLASQFHIDGFPIAVPALDIHTVGAGGGSIASFDQGGALKVGPESAGADPGPICYGRGDRPTVTDADLVLGRIDPGGFLAGGIQLQAERTQAAFEHARGPLPSPIHLAQGIVRLADLHMAAALRRISVEQGHDPRDFTLVTFGGAGPLHACALARALQMRRVLVPNYPGALSAYGILISDVVRDFSRTVMLQPSDARLRAELDALQQRALQELPGAICQTFVDVRYVGQAYELPIPFSTASESEFHSAHQKRYGYCDRNRPLEVVTVRVRAVLSTQPITMQTHELKPGDGHQAVVARRQIFCENGWQMGAIYDRETLNPGDCFPGPAVIREYSATTFVPADVSCRVDSRRNLVLEFA